MGAAALDGFPPGSVGPPHPSTSLGPEDHWRDGERPKWHPHIVDVNSYRLGASERVIVPDP